MKASPPILTAHRLLFVCLALAMTTLPVDAKVSVAPAFIDVELNEGPTSGRFWITNLGEEEERFRMNALHFIFTAEGELQEIPPDDRSLATWIKFNPREFTVPPKTKRVVRFAVVPRRDLAHGEYWAALELESLRTNSIEAAYGDGGALNLEITSAILVPVFGKVGRLARRGAVLDIGLERGADGVDVWALVANQGTTRLFLTGQFAILDSEGAEVASGPLGAAYVLRDHDRRFAGKALAELAGGSYTVRVRFDGLSMEETIRDEIRLPLDPPQPAGETPGNAGTGSD